VTDFVLNGSATELATLRELGELGAAFQVPVCFSVTPRFLGLDEAAQADTVEYLGTRFDGATYDGWRALREKEVSRWLVAAFNPVLGREPYRVRLGDTAWEERFPRDGDRPWMDPAWAVAGLAARSSARMEWATEITLGSGAELAGFPVRPHPAGTGAGATQIPLGAALTDQAARDLAKQGIAALACRPNRDGVFLVRAPVVRSPSRYGVTAADAASRRMATLPYQFLAARVARVVEEQLEREDLAQADVAPALHLALRSLVANTGQGSHVEVNTTSGEEGHRLRVTTRTGNAVLGGAEVVLEVPLDSR
jgi:type VI secretion system protein ImpC